MQEPKISVIIPVYNGEKYLARCIKSVLNQNYSNLEIVLIDDGSKDKSQLICNEFAEEDIRIKVFHKSNGGVSSARNLGLEKCTGEYIIFVDSDDYLPSDKNIYKKIMHVSLLNDADIVTWLWQFQDDKGNFTVKKDKISVDFKGKLTGVEFAKLWYKGAYENGLVTSVWNKLYKRELIINEKFKYNIFEDDDWMGRILQKTQKIVCLNEFFYIYAQNNESLTHKVFSQEHLDFLPILIRRSNLFAEEKFLYSETVKLFCNLYIEYYFKAKENRLVFSIEKKIFYNYVQELKSRGDINKKTYIRFLIFSISPSFYKILFSFMRK